MATTRRTYTWNAFESALSSGIDGSATTITLDSVVGLREPNGYLVLDPDDPAAREYIKYTSIVGNTLQGVQRGLNGGNTNQPHNSSATIRAVPTHQHYDDLWDTTEELIQDDANHIAAIDPHSAAGYITETAGDARYLQLSGGGMTGPIDMQTSKIIGLGAPTVDADAANKLYVDNAVSGGVATYLPLAGGVMTGDINMSGNKIINLINPPVDPGEATRKDYVDTTAVGAVTGHEGTIDPHDNSYVPITGGTFSGIVQFTNGLTSLDAVFGDRFFAYAGGGIGSPIFSFVDQPTTGMYLPDPGDLRFTVDNDLVLRLQQALVSISADRLQIPSGSDTALPGIYFAGDQDTGIAHTANIMAFSTGGVERLRLVNSASHTINGGPLRAIYSGVAAPTTEGVNGDLYAQV